MSLPEWKSFVLQQVAYINKLSIPIGKVELLPLLPRKYVSVSDAGYVTSVFSLVPGNWLLLKTVLAVNVWKRRACSVFLLIPYRCISSFFCIALDLLFSFQQNGQFADSSFFPLGSAG